MLLFDIFHMVWIVLFIGISYLLVIDRGNAMIEEM